MSDSARYEIRERPLRTCLLSPFSDGVVCCLDAALIALIVLGGWLLLIGLAGAVLFLIASYRLEAHADSDGIEVRNRFVRHRIAWQEVRGLVSREQPTLFTFIPTVAVLRRGSPWFAINIYATLGMSAGRRSNVALELAEFGRQHGFVIPAGSESDFQTDSPRD